MPVLIVGAQTAMGTAAVRTLMGTGGEVRAYADAQEAGDEEAAALRALGAKVAVGDLDDEGHLEAALEQVHTVGYLARDPFADPDAQLDALATTLSAAIGAGCRRLVWTTELAASDAGGNPYLSALAAMETLLGDAPMEIVTLRCALSYALEDPVTRRVVTADLAGAAGAAHAPLYVGDVAEAVRAADRQRDANPDVRIAVELVGPQQMTLATFADALRQALDVKPHPKALPDPVADWLARPAVGGSDALGRQMGTPLARVIGSA